jgi:putative ABC transport system permease protein
MHPGADGKPKKVGDELMIGNRPFKIVGLYETGSLILDVVMIMDINIAREVLNEPKDSLSCIYVEGSNPADNTNLAEAIEKANTGLDARSMNEAQANDREPRLGRRYRRHHQHHAHEHERTVPRVRRAPH